MALPAATPARNVARVASAENCGCLIDGFPGAAMGNRTRTTNASSATRRSILPAGRTVAKPLAAAQPAMASVAPESAARRRTPAAWMTSRMPPGCLIDGQEIRSGDTDPANECQFCEPATATDAWTPLADGGLCGETAAQCCQAGVCTICGCLIGGGGFIDGEPNPENECQQCDHALDPGNWSPRNETFTCGPGGTQSAAMALLPHWQLLQLGRCLRGVFLRDRGRTGRGTAFSPDNRCLFCDPASSTTRLDLRTGLFRLQRPAGDDQSLLLPGHLLPGA